MNNEILHFLDVSAPYVLIQEVFWNSKISSLLSRIVDKIQNSKLMQRNIPTNLFGCLYSLLKKKLHFGNCFYIWYWNSSETNSNLTLTMWTCIHTIWIIINSVSSDFWGKKIKVASDNQIRLRAKLNTKQFREGHIVWRNNRSKHDGVIFNW